MSGADWSNPALYLIVFIGLACVVASIYIWLNAEKIRRSRYWFAGWLGFMYLSANGICILSDPMYVVHQLKL